MQPSFPRFVNNVLILTGVFGTVSSLIFALVGATDVLQTAVPGAGMGLLLLGMNTALTTTATAIVCYFFFTYFYHRFTDLQTWVISRLERAVLLYMVPDFTFEAETVNHQTKLLVEDVRELVVEMREGLGGIAQAGHPDRRGDPRPSSSRADELIARQDAQNGKTGRSAGPTGRTAQRAGRGLPAGPLGKEATVHLFRGYPDLRLNRSSTSTDTSLWPSFTDIMTVILMVFMLTMVVVIIKNADLIDQIRLSRQLQAEAEERLASNVQVLADLRVRNTDLEEAIRSSRMEIILLTDEAERLEASLDIKAAAIARLEGREGGAGGEHPADPAAAERKGRGPGERPGDDRRHPRRGRARQPRTEPADRRPAEPAGEQRSHVADPERRKERPGDGPGPAAPGFLLAGGQVPQTGAARAQFARQAGGLGAVPPDEGRATGIMLKDIGSEQWEEMSRNDLFQRLGALKERLGEELYIKIVIPDDSGLTYNEAWGFTKTVLTEFDYYYIEGW